jgi:hypothetical protein
VTSSVLGETAVPTPPQSSESAPTGPGVVTTTTTGPAGERPAPSGEGEGSEALPLPSTDDDGGGGAGMLSGWVLLALILGVGGALAAAAMLSGGITAMTKRNEG